MKLTEKELIRLATLVTKEIYDDKAYILEIDTRLKELETIMDKLTKEIDKRLKKTLKEMENQDIENALLNEDLEDPFIYSVRKETL